MNEKSTIKNNFNKNPFRNFEKMKNVLKSLCLTLGTINVVIKLYLSHLSNNKKIRIKTSDINRIKCKRGNKNLQIDF